MHYSLFGLDAPEERRDDLQNLWWIRGNLELDEQCSYLNDKLETYLYKMHLYTFNDRSWTSSIRMYKIIYGFIDIYYEMR